MKYTIDAIQEIRKALDIVLDRIHETHDFTEPYGQSGQERLILQDAVNTLQEHRRYLGEITVSL